MNVRGERLFFAGDSASASPSNHEGHGGAATGGALFATKFGRVDDHGDSRHGRPLAAFE